MLGKSAKRTLSMCQKKLKFWACSITVEHRIRIAEIRVQFPVGPLVFLCIPMKISFFLKNIVCDLSLSVYATEKEKEHFLMNSKACRKELHPE